MKVDSLANNNLISILKTFSTDDWKEFDKFVQSPFFNKGRNYLPIVKILRKFSPDFQSPELNKKDIYDMLYPGKVYKDSVMKSMLSRLYDIAEEFIFQVAIRNSNVLLKERFLLGEFGKRGLKTRSEKLIRETEKLMAQRKTGILDFVTLKDYFSEKVNHHYNFNERSKCIEQMFEYQAYVAYAFLTEFLINDANLFSQKNYWNKEISRDDLLNLTDSFDFKKILSVIKKTDMQVFAVLNMFYLLRMAYRDPEQDDFYFKLKKEVFSNLDKIDLDFRKYILNALMVLCSVKTVFGKEEFRREGFSLRKKIYDENLNIFSDEHYLKNGDFRTAFIEALAVGEIKWAENFSGKYISMLQPEYRKDMQYYVQANFLFLKKNYEDSLNMANKVNINQISFKLDLKNLTAKIYYETDSVENLYAYLNTYYQFINNSKSQNKDFLLRHLNFIRQLRRLLNIRFNGNDETELRMLLDLIESENITSKKWLIKKVNLLIPDKKR